MAKITVEIECDGHKCGKCGHRLYSESIIGTNWDSWYCLQFNKDIGIGSGDDLLRLPECIAAEVKKGER